MLFADDPVTGLAPAITNFILAFTALVGVVLSLWKTFQAHQAAKDGDAKQQVEIDDLKRKIQ